MKRCLVIGVILAAVLALFSCASTSGFVRDDPDNDSGIGRLSWSITDESGGVVEQGELVNGTFRMNTMLCRDIHFLDYREDGTVKVGLGIWGNAAQELEGLHFMVLYDDEFHPAKQWSRAYIDDEVELYYDWRDGIGYMPAFLAIPEGHLLEVELNNGYTFQIHPGSVYVWAPVRVEVPSIGNYLVWMDEAHEAEHSGDYSPEEYVSWAERVGAPHVTLENMQILACEYLAAGYPTINHQIGPVVYKYAEE